MNHKSYKYVITFLTICCIGTTFAQKFEKKFSENFKTNKDVKIYINASHTDINVTSWNKNEVQVYVKEDIYKTIPKARKKYLKAYIQYDGPILAPIKKNQKVGVLKVLYKDEIINEYEVYAFEDVRKLNVISRIIKSINYLIWGDV